MSAELKDPKGLFRKSNRSSTVSSEPIDTPQEMSALQGRVDGILTHRYCEPTIAFVIFVNFVIICVETDYGASCSRLEDPGDCMPAWLTVVNNVLLGIYTMEISARIFAYRCRVLRSGWSIFDLIIVSVGYVDFIATQISAASVPGLAMLRIFRVARLIRAARFLRFFPTLNSMLRGFLNAMSAMWLGFGGIMVLVVMWAVFFVNFVDPVNQGIDHAEDEIYCRDAFSSIFNTIILLFQCLVAGDSWGRCSIPVIVRSPIFFFPFAGALITIQLGFTNLILATIVERASTASLTDREAHAQQELQTKRKRKQDAEARFLEICTALDTDAQGTISFDEFIGGYETSEEFRTCMGLMDIEKDELEGFFTYMDLDDSGDLSYHELVRALEKMDNQDLRKQLLTMKMQIEEVFKHVRRLEHERGHEHRVKHHEFEGQQGAPKVSGSPRKISKGSSRGVESANAASERITSLQRHIAEELGSIITHVVNMEGEHLRPIKLESCSEQGKELLHSHTWPLNGTAQLSSGWQDPQSLWGVRQECLDDDSVGSDDLLRYGARKSMNGMSGSLRASEATQHRCNGAASFAKPSPRSHSALPEDTSRI